MAAPQTRAGDRSDLTPAMRQYMEQKAAAPDALLLFRMGDFYETFYEDAQTAARVLGIALTSRGKDGSQAPIPLAGIPYHALESYLSKLVRAGYKVAISEQVEDPRTARGVVKREIVRIVTPGTLTEDALLEQRSDNYLACACMRGDECGMAVLELSTGAFWTQLVEPRELVDELVRLAPAEMLLPDTGIDASDPLCKMVKELNTAGAIKTALTRRPPHLFDPFQAEQRLRRQFGVATLAGFGFDTMDASLCAAAVVVDYLAETQRTSLQHISRIVRRDTSDTVCIDQATWRALEIERILRSGSSTGSLLEAVDRTCSAMGARCLRRWLKAPLRSAGAIRSRQDAIAELLSDRDRLSDVRSHLGRLADIERITARLGVGRASPRDLVSLGQTLQTIERAADVLRAPAKMLSDAPAALGSFAEPETPGISSFLQQRVHDMSGLQELAQYLTASLRPDAPLTMNEGGIIAPGFDAELDRLHGIATDGRTWLADFQAREIERTGIPSLKVGFNNVFGYYIEITHTHRDRVPADYVRKQTVKSAERYITDELKRHETEVLTARERANTREAELFDGIRNHTIAHIPALQRLACAVAEIDTVAGLAWLAEERRYVRPELCEDCVLEIVDGRHPVLEQTLGEKFVPNDCRLGLSAEGAPPGAEREMLVILTGPNMAGKSTYIRQVALLTLLAQTGSYVPARSMRLAPADRVFARIGASDEITRGQSTFMVEMTEAANILNNATPRSLVILDELGRGTSTYDGMSLAWAIAEHLATRIGCRALFATHYHELTQLESLLPRVVNFNVAVREWQDEIVFLYRILRGGTDRSYGVHVAKLAGIPPEVIARSRELLAEFETGQPGRAAPPAGRRPGSRRKKDDQLLLFADPSEEIIRELQELKPEAMTPLDALQAIQRWRDRLSS